MYSAKAIANYFLQKGEDTDVDITPMQILKLVYIAHGWNLALLDNPLIEDRIEAWKYGPVIPSLYEEFKGFGRDPIAKGYRAEEVVAASIIPEANSEVELSDTLQLLDEVWDTYKGFDGIDLSELTHQEGTPWETTRKSKWFRRSPPIKNEAIRDYYVKMSEKGNGK